MKRTPVYLVLLTVFIDLVGFGIIIPLLPFYAQHFGATPTVIGLLSSSYSVMQFLFVPFWGRFSDRIGRRPIILMSVTGSFISYMIFGFSDSLALLFISRILAGFMGANISTAQAYIADTTSVEERARYMGFIGAAFGFGFMLGPFIGGVLSRISYGAPGFFASGISLANVVLAYFMLPESNPRYSAFGIQSRGSARKISWLNVAATQSAFRNHGIRNLVLVFFFYTVAFSILYVAFPLFSKEILKYDAEDNGYFFAYVGMVGIIIQGGAIGRLARRFGEKSLVTAGLAFFVSALVLVPVTRALSTLIVSATLLAVGSAFIAPSLTSLISKYAGTGEQGSTLGVSQSFSSLGRVIGPFLGGFIIGTTGFAWPFLTGAIMIVIALILSLRAASPASQKSG
ncbi:MAG TPA: MFS transporter [Candidatus Acidoferrales bacterium]|nr:MFS transporter [Candidatus Acidoferrales bacterium]